MRFASRFRANHFLKLFFPWVLLLLTVAIARRERNTLARLRGEATLPDAQASATEIQNTDRQVWSDSLSDGFPDILRLETVQDRHNFVLWFTFLAEAPYYRPRGKVEKKFRIARA